MSQQSLTSAKNNFDSMKGLNPYFFLDYDGTLVPLITEPEKAFADDELKELLMRLYSKYRTFIITGRSLTEIDTLLGMKLNSIGWHGAMARIDGKLIYLMDNADYYLNAIDSLMDMQDYFEKKYPGLRMMDKRPGVLFLLWGNSEAQIADLENELIDIAHKRGLAVITGKQIIELIPPGTGKGNAIRKIRNGSPCIVIGDDLTDEDSFSKNGDCLTIKVGPGKTSAKVRFDSIDEVRDFLEYAVSA
ncbi:MAG: trehalose-phosphatase [Thermoplasmataceae archaeon]|jgi:trehalose 6-phosphate phosphatase